MRTSATVVRSLLRCLSVKNREKWSEFDYFAETKGRNSLELGLDGGPGKIRTCTCEIWGTYPPCYLTLPVRLRPSSRQLLGSVRNDNRKGPHRRPPRQMQAPLRKDAQKRKQQPQRRLSLAEPLDSTPSGENDIAGSIRCQGKYRVVASFSTPRVEIFHKFVPRAPARAKTDKKASSVFRSISPDSTHSVFAFGVLLAILSFGWRVATGNKPLPAE